MGNSYEKINNREVREYNKIIKKYKLCKDEELTIKVNGYFGVEFINNYTIPPEYWGEADKIINKDEEIELQLEKSLYPHPLDSTGGDTHYIYGFKATKKGIYKIEFSTYILTVNVV